MAGRPLALAPPALSVRRAPRPARANAAPAPPAASAARALAR
jgi:hypothetical protein